MADSGAKPAGTETFTAGVTWTAGEAGVGLVDVDRALDGGREAAVEAEGEPGDADRALGGGVTAARSRWYPPLQPPNITPTASSTADICLKGNPM